MSRKRSGSLPVAYCYCMIGNEMKRVYSHMTMQICTRQATGFQHEDRVEADRPSQEGDCDVSHLEDRCLRTPNGFLLALRGLGMGAVSSLAGVYSNQRQQMMEKLSRHKLWRAMSSFLGIGRLLCGHLKYNLRSLQYLASPSPFGGGLDMGKPCQMDKNCLNGPLFSV